MLRRHLPIRPLFSHLRIQRFSLALHVSHKIVCQKFTAKIGSPSHLPLRQPKRHHAPSALRPVSPPNCRPRAFRMASAPSYQHIRIYRGRRKHRSVRKKTPLPKSGRMIPVNAKTRNPPTQVFCCACAQKSSAPCNPSVQSRAIGIIRRYHRADIPPYS